MDLNPAIAMAMLNIVTEYKVSFRRLDWIRMRDQLPATYKTLTVKMNGQQTLQLMDIHMGTDEGSCPMTKAQFIYPKNPKYMLPKTRNLSISTVTVRYFSMPFKTQNRVLTP